MDSAKTALLFGASGLVGSYVLKELEADSSYSKIKIFTRRPLNSNIAKAEEILTDFERFSEVTNHLTGDVIFCCLGTTISKAGSREAFRKVDYDLPIMIGNAAAINKISNMMVVSSLGADDKSNNFYLRTKGQMEKDLKSTGIPNLKFFRPSMLLGPRSESRPAETIGKVLMKLMDPFFIGKIKKYRAIHASTVARAMVRVSVTGYPESIIESDTIEKLAQ